MTRIRRLLLAAIGLVVLLGAGAWIFRAQLAPLLGVNVDTGPGGAADLALPAGYTAEVFAEGLAGPRFMTVAPDGTLLVAERGADRVVGLPDTDADGRSDETIEIGVGYGQANDLAFTPTGALLVAGQTTLHEVTLDGLVEVERRTLVSGLPDSGFHTSKSVVSLPEGDVLLSIGSSCNVCFEEDDRRAGIHRVTDAGLDSVMVGLRNAVGLWVDPDTGRAWASNMGRDLLGDHEPPETLYEIVEGADAGWPGCHAGSLPDPEFGAGDRACADVARPAATFPAHTAPLAIVGWGDHLYVALHGSWNSSVKVGYAVWRVAWSDDGPIGEPQPFATGFLPEGATDAVGRPAGLAVGSDGALYVSDDKGGFVYRITAP